MIWRYWRRGIASETAAASLIYAFDTLDAKEVFGMIDCDNIASNKILAKADLSLYRNLIMMVSSITGIA